MKKILLMTVMSLMTLALAAQTYNNPRQSSNNKRLKVTKVERTSNATILYLKYTMLEDETGWSRIDAYPVLIDEATGKRYQATDALNFNWGTKYKKTVTYKIEFPPLPRSTSVVTFRETSDSPFIVSNIALPIQNQQNQSNSSQAYNKANNNSNGQNSSNGQISANVDRVWTEHGVYKDEKKGMMIHVKFDVKNALGKNGKVIAYFNFQDGKALDDFNGKYCTTEGHVCASKKFSPKYNNSSYNDFQIFMPYSELHMGSGSSKLDFYVVIWVESKQYDKSNRYKFKLNSN